MKKTIDISHNYLLHGQNIDNKSIFIPGWCGQKSSVLCMCPVVDYKAKCSYGIPNSNPVARIFSHSKVKKTIRNHQEMRLLSHDNDLD